MSLPRQRMGSVREGRRPIGLSEPISPAGPTKGGTDARATSYGPAKEGSRRPPGTSRLAPDIDSALAERFRERAFRRRWSQRDALTGALALLEELDDGAYDALLSRVTGR